MRDTCNTCAKANLKDSMCSVLKVGINPTKDTCPLHSAKVKSCSLCGGPMLKGVIVARSNHIICDNCLQASSTCNACSHAVKCDFEENPSTLPKVVMKTVRQGPAVMQTQVRNPDRIAETCAKGCGCYDPEIKECNRQNGGSCGNHKWIGETI